MYWPPAIGPRMRLGTTARRAVFLVHLVFALGWFGIDVVIGILAVTADASDDPELLAVCYAALDVFVVPVLFIFGFGALPTGITLALANSWGLVRYWWLAIKLALNVVLTALVFILLVPRFETISAEIAVIDDSLVSRLGTIPTDLLFPAFVSGCALLFAAFLGVFTPWGRVRGRR